MYIAHSKNDVGRRHDLYGHLISTADRANAFLQNKPLSDLAYLAGILHDLGKIHPDFQNKIQEQSDDRVDHKGLGVAFAKKLTNSEFLCRIIAAHHGGLKNFKPFENWFKGILEEGKIYEVTNEASKIIEKFKISNANLSKIENGLPIQKDVAMRMVLSALVDADFLDTENHFNPEKTDIRKSFSLTENHWDHFLKYHQSLSRGKQGGLNQLRNDVYNSCIEKAKRKTGFFRLTVPTGGGKTLSSLGFALQHAKSNNQNRIIYGIPFTSIIEQIAGVFKAIFPSNIVLEHHTGIHVEESDEYDEKKKWNQLASENWDAPIIVTTTVQLFESLFARSTSKCRKLHNIINSVIILDEVQTLPLELMPTIMSVLKDLVFYFNVSVVFCTATQPALDEFLSKENIVPTELAPNPKKIFKKLERVKYRNESNKKWEWEQVADEMRSVDRVMSVVNTKKDAHELWRTLSDETIYHLSSAMCGAHRKDTLDEIRKKLKKKEECKLVATQVVEAGVDVDFDKVLRAIGPLDRIVQAAGRCNREGNLKKGDVIIFNPKEGSMPQGIYLVGKHKASQLLNNPNAKVDLNDPKTFPDYFSKLYQNIQLDPKGIETNRNKLKFEYVARDFKMIDDDSVSVIVNYKPDRVQRLIEKLNNLPQTARETIRELQPFMINLPRWEFNKNQQFVQEIFSDLFLWTGKYDSRLGLLKEFNLTSFVT